MCCPSIRAVATFFGCRPGPLFIRVMSARRCGRRALAASRPAIRDPWRSPVRPDCCLPPNLIYSGPDKIERAGNDRHYRIWRLHPAPQASAQSGRRGEQMVRAGLVGGAKGERAMANWDEDAVTLGRRSRRAIALPAADAIEGPRLRGCDLFRLDHHAVLRPPECGHRLRRAAASANVSSADIASSLRAGLSALICRARRRGCGAREIAACRRRREAQSARGVVRRRCAMAMRARR